MDQPLLPVAIAEPMPSGASSAAAPVRPGTGRADRSVAVVALGSERPDGRPPDEPTPGQRARERRDGRPPDEPTPGQRERERWDPPDTKKGNEEDEAPKKEEEQEDGEKPEGAPAAEEEEAPTAEPGAPDTESKGAAPPRPGESRKLRRDAVHQGR